MRVFWAKVSKKAIFGYPVKKKRKFWLITEKLFFWYFCVFLLFLSWFFFFCCFLLFFVLFYFFLFLFCFCLEGLRVRWGGPKGHLTWPLTLLIFLLLFFFFCFVFFGGFKGQVRWPKGPPHLALNPPYFLFFFLVFVFLSLLCFLCFFNRQKTCFPPRKGHFLLLIFNVSLSFSLNLFWPPPFSVSLSLSLCCSFLFSFLLVFFFAFFLFLVFISFFPFLSSLLLFHEKKNIKIFNCNFFLKYFLFLLVSCLAFLFQIPFSYLCFFLILSYVFCSTSMFLVSKRTNWKAQKNKKKPIATKRFFFMNLCFAKCQKLSFFLPLFCQILVDVQKTLQN